MVASEGQRYLGILTLERITRRSPRDRAGPLLRLAAEPLIRWEWIGDHLDEIWAAGWSTCSSPC